MLELCFPLFQSICPAKRLDSPKRGRSIKVPKVDTRVLPSAAICNNSAAFFLSLRRTTQPQILSGFHLHITPSSRNKALNKPTTNPPINHRDTCQASTTRRTSRQGRVASSSGAFCPPWARCWPPWARSRALEARPCLRWPSTGASAKAPFPSSGSRLSSRREKTWERWAGACRRRRW